MDHNDIKQVAENVYLSLLGNLLPEYALNWVENIFVPGHPCHDEYSDMLKAYRRACARLGNTDEDPDLEIMVNSLLSHCQVLAFKMFEYGVIFAQNQTEQ